MKGREGGRTTETRAKLEGIETSNTSESLSLDGGGDVVMASFDDGELSRVKWSSATCVCVCVLIEASGSSGDGSDGSSRYKLLS